MRKERKVKLRKAAKAMVQIIVEQFEKHGLSDEEIDQKFKRMKKVATEMRVARALDMAELQRMFKL